MLWKVFKSQAWPEEREASATKLRVPKQVLLAQAPATERQWVPAVRMAISRADRLYLWRKGSKMRGPAQKWQGLGPAQSQGLRVPRQEQKLQGLEKGSALDALI